MRIKILAIDMNKENIFKLVAILVPIIALTFDFFIGVAVLVIICGLLYFTKNLPKKGLALAIVIFFVFAELYFLYFQPAVYIAKSQGTILDDNWYQALTWLKENTPECTVVATYWDPGHFITGVARRAVVFDGASQGELFSRKANYTEEGVKVELKTTRLPASRLAESNSVLVNLYSKRVFSLSGK